MRVKFSLISLLLLIPVTGCSNPFESACEKVDRLASEEAKDPAFGTEEVSERVREASDAIEKCNAEE